jgi:hypothetical protein
VVQALRHYAAIIEEGKNFPYLIWFSGGPETGDDELHQSAEEATAGADLLLSAYRQDTYDMSKELWHEDTTEIRWGLMVNVERAYQIPCTCWQCEDPDEDEGPPDPEHCDYELRPVGSASVALEAAP